MTPALTARQLALLVELRRRGAWPVRSARLAGFHAQTWRLLVERGYVAHNMSDRISLTAQGRAAAERELDRRVRLGLVEP